MSLWTGPWHFYIASVQTNEAMYVERLLKNMAAPSNSQGPATHKSYQKRNCCYLGLCVNSYVLILLSIWPIASWIFSYKKRSCPLRPFSASGFKSVSGVSTPEISDPPCFEPQSWYPHLSVRLACLLCSMFQHNYATSTGTICLQ